MKGVREAARVLSMDGAFYFTPRNLYYELVRMEAIAPPAGNPRAELIEFRRALKRWERENGALEMLVRARPARRAVPARDMPDVFDYAVRRALVFDRLETCLLFIKNGFHRKIEIALLAWPDFPAHVWKRLLAQAESGPRTAFYTVHDASPRGAKLLAKAQRVLRGHGVARFADVGLAFGHAFTLGVSVRQSKARASAPGDDLEHESLMLATGNYAHLEELRPRELMRWVYARIARGPEDPGFG